VRYGARHREPQDGIGVARIEAAAVPARRDLELPEQPRLFAAHGGAPRLIVRAGFVPVTPKRWSARVVGGIFAS
jgi:hypothetical protein